MTTRWSKTKSESCSELGYLGSFLLPVAWRLTLGHHCPEIQRARKEVITMEEETKQVDDTAREPWHGKKHNCVINIFCGDKKNDGKWDWGKHPDGNCIINIFCNDKKHDDECDDDIPGPGLGW
jgi:hypothetical protein